MLIQMLHTSTGSSDGFTVHRYLEGQTYDTSKNIGHGLACQFVNRQQAFKLSDKGVEETVAELMELLTKERN